MLLTPVRPFPKDVLEYLRVHHIITLSTASFTGMPHANTVAYASEESAIYFSIGEDTTVARNVADNRYMSFTIDDYTTDWRKVRELQGVGECQPVQLDDRDGALRALHEKFVRSPARLFGGLYRIRPLEVHFVDYDYARVSADEGVGAPELTSRVYQLDEVSTVPPHGAVSTSLPSSTFAAGEIIFRPGDPGGQFYVIVDGEVEVRGEGYGADQTVVRLGAGRMFGDQATLRGQRGALTAHAVTDCALLAIARDAVRDLLLQQP